MENKEELVWLETHGDLYVNLTGVVNLLINFADDLEREAAADGLTSVPIDIAAYGIRALAVRALEVPVTEAAYAASQEEGE